MCLNWIKSRRVCWVPSFLFYNLPTATPQYLIVWQKIKAKDITSCWIYWPLRWPLAVFSRCSFIKVPHNYSYFNSAHLHRSCSSIYAPPSGFFLMTITLLQSVTTAQHGYKSKLHLSPPSAPMYTLQVRRVWRFSTDSEKCQKGFVISWQQLSSSAIRELFTLLLRVLLH